MVTFKEDVKLTAGEEEGKGEEGKGSRERDSREVQHTQRGGWKLAGGKGNGRQGVWVCR